MTDTIETTRPAAARLADPLIRLEGLKKAFPIKAGVLQRTVAEVRAVDGVDLEIGRGIVGKRAEVTLSASSFIPKPETPFQWVGMERLEHLHRTVYRRR